MRATHSPQHGFNRLMKTKLHFFHLCGACLAVGVATMLPARTWTEAQTGRTLEGELVRVLDQMVVIRLANGSTIQLPLARLSEGDQGYVKEQAAKTTAKKGEESTGKDDLKKRLLGTWKGYMANNDGSNYGDIQLVITENEITASNPRGQQIMGAGSYSISGAGGKLHRIDAKGSSGQFQGKNYEGVFAIEGSTLRWCSANDNPRSQRPDKLETNTQAGQFLMVLEKER